MSNNNSKSDPRQGVLYVVATPIGNLSDISHRAIEVLKNVDLVLAEDTRHSKRLFNHYHIQSTLKACHEHNEQQLCEWVRQQLNEGLDIALISDAGTPLISDPGFVLVRELRRLNHTVLAVPGPSSIIAALSVAGLPTDSFVYDGFLPAKTSARRTALQQYLAEPRTVVLLESSHRIMSCLRDVIDVLGAQRSIVLARELTKKFETVLAGEVHEVLAKLESDSDQTRGEFVLMLKGVEVKSDNQEMSSLLKLLMAEVPTKQAVALTSKITGVSKNEVYQLALSFKKKLSEQ